MKFFARISIAAIACVVFSFGAQADTPKEEPTDPATMLGVSSYEPLYFMLGNHDGFNAKFQISFKYQLFKEDGVIAQHINAFSHVYLSYSQTSLWDLHERSSPFKDTSYRPRLFYSDDKLWQSQSKTWDLGVQAGLAHESNGKADPDSRSINLGYIRPRLAYNFSNGRQIYVAPMIVSYIDKGENPDINQYRGNVDLLIGWGGVKYGLNGNTGKHDWNVWTVLRKGDTAHYGSVEANLAIPFSVFNKNMNGWLLTQYFSGWGESLLEYNQKFTSQFRVGFAILVQ